MTTHPARRVALIGAATALLGGTMLAAAPANAVTPTPHPDPDTVASTMAHKLGARSAGSYLDRASGRVVVTVTNTADADAVRAAGAVPKSVTRSGADLGQVTATLDRTAKVPGTAWAVDPASNKVVVSVDQTVTGAKLAKVRAAAARLGGAVQVQHVAGTFSTRISGGDAILGSQVRCSLGFNVQGGGATFFITAGHCGNIEPTWFTSGGQVIGDTADSQFPGNDFAIVQYTGSVPADGTVGGQDITSAADPVVGEAVQRRGSTTGVHGGTVTATGQTVNFDDGTTVFGMIQTNVCAEPGDSGGPLYDGSTALGITSGGSGDCTSGGVTFFQPITEALSTYGVNVF